MRLAENTQHETSKVLRLPCKRRCPKSAAPATKNATHLLKTWQKYCACHTKTTFDASWSMLGCHQSATPATPATQNDITTCFETFDKERFCSFPQRHCDGTTEASDSRRDMLEHQNEHFMWDFLKFHTICSFKINVFRRIFLWTYRKIKVSCEASVDFHHMSQLPRLPRNLHLVTTSRSADNAMRKNHAARDVQSAAPATQNEIRGVQSGAPASKNATHLLKTWQKYCACHTKTTFDASWSMLGCHQSATPATPATQNDITTCFETFDKERFCSFPQRHCDGTTEASDSRRDMLEHQNEHFMWDFLKFHTICSFKINVFRRIFLWTYRKIKVSCEASVDFHHMSQLPRLPRNLHLVTTSRSADNAMRKNHAARDVQSAAPATQNEIRGVQSGAPASKNATHLLKMLQKYCACPTKWLLTRVETCWNATKCHACHAKWSYSTLESSKSDPFCRTSYRHGHTVLTRTVADGCEDVNATVRRTQLYPHTPRVKREPLLRIRKKCGWFDEGVFRDTRFVYNDYKYVSNTGWGTTLSGVLNREYIVHRMLSKCSYQFYCWIGSCLSFKTSSCYIILVFIVSHWCFTRCRHDSWSILPRNRNSQKNHNSQKSPQKPDCKKKNM